MPGLLAFGDAGWGDEILAGLWITLSLALATLPFGLLLGFAVALCQRSAALPLRWAGNLYTTIFRGLPELLTLFLVFYGLPILISQIQLLFVDEATFEVNSFVAGIIALAAVFSSYAAEVFLSAFRGVGAGQQEGARALGMRRLPTLLLVTLPQLLRLALPGLANLWMILLKETALVSVIALPDLLRQTAIAARVTKEPFLFFSVACALYLALALFSSVGIWRIEKWAARGRA